MIAVVAVTIFIVVGLGGGVSFLSSKAGYDPIAWTIGYATGWVLALLSQLIFAVAS